MLAECRQGRMGVGDFQAFLEREPSLRVGVTSLDLVRAAWAREGKGGARPGRLALVSGHVVVNPQKDLHVSSRCWMPRVVWTVCTAASTATGAAAASGTTC